MSLRNLKGILVGKRRRRTASKAPKARTIAQKKTVQISVPEIAVISNAGARENQQDSFTVPSARDIVNYSDRGIFAAVADGMGGLASGDEASGIAVGVAAEYFKSVGVTARPHQALLQMAAQANKNILNYINCGSEVAGTTLISVYVKQDSLWFLSVGDSRIYLYRAGKLLVLNRDHIYARTLDVEYAEDRISMAEAEGDPQRRSLTDYLGKEKLSAYDFNMDPIGLMAGDGILLMTDGVFNTLSESEMEHVLAEKAPQDAVSLMQNEILNKKKSNQDNFTCVYIKI